MSKFQLFFRINDLAGCIQKKGNNQNVLKNKALIKMLKIINVILDKIKYSDHNLIAESKLSTTLKN